LFLVALVLLLFLQEVVVEGRGLVELGADGLLVVADVELQGFDNTALDQSYSLGKSVGDDSDAISEHLQQVREVIRLVRLGALAIFKYS
jgi:hypothetical protein